MANAGDSSRAVVAMSWRILPLLGLGYLFALMDRINVSFAALQMNDELGFSATVYGLGAGMFYLAYALFEVPSNLLMLKVGPRRWLARIMVTWGFLAAGMMFVTTPMQFYVMRFLLGMAEAGFFPAIVFYLAKWFPRSIRGRAISRFYLFGPLSSVVMGGLSAWLLGLHGAGGLSGWQWLFVVQGLPAALVGIAFLLWLPDSPRSVSWLTADQCDRIEAELSADAARMGPTTSHSILEVMRDPIVLQFGIIGLLTIGATVTFTLSAPLMLKANGLSESAIGLLVSGGGLLGAASMLLVGWVTDRSRDRFPAMLVSTAGMAIAFIMMSAASNGAVSVIAYLLFAASWCGITMALVSAWPDFLHGTRLVVGCAAINTLNQLGAFGIPLAWGWAKDMTGGYHAGLTGITLATGLAFLLMLALRSQLVRRIAPATATVAA